MPLKKGVYLIECVPKEDNLREGALLHDFLNMLLPDRIEYHEVTDKDNFIDTLKNNSKVVHISCHGTTDENGNFCMIMPDDEPFFPNEFYKNDYLKGRNVVITGCGLGRAGFSKEFLERTQAESLLSPVNIIDFADSAMWCVNFYYHLFTRNSFSFDKSYKYMKDNFYVPGAMKQWGWREE
ncbi:hypothetical protein ig2599ANME_1095 [groundwater metagenome]